MSDESVFLLEENSSSQADNKSVVQAAVSLSPVDVPEEKVAGERGEESPVGGPEGPNEVGGTEAGTEAEMEDEDEDADVAGGIDEVEVSGYKSEGFTLSEILRQKRLAKKNVSEGVVCTAHLPQCEFSNLQHLALASLLEFFCCSVIKFYSNEPGLPRTDVSGSEFEVGAPTSEEENEKKRVRQNAL